MEAYSNIIPSAAQEAFKRDHPDVGMRSAEKQNVNGSLLYNFSYTDSAGQPREAVYDAAGQRLR